MPYDQAYPDQRFNAESPPRPGMPVWAWLLIAFGGFFVLSCGCCSGLLIYVGATSPDTFIYAGNEVPGSYAQTAKDLGLLDDDETLLWFYSDGFLDVAEGFYFVSDKKVGVYIESSAQPATAVTFDQIVAADLYRDTSFLEDSVITLELRDGTIVSFPVSSERDRDVKFHEAIEQRINE